jgi:hypothetical protein
MSDVDAANGSEIRRPPAEAECGTVCEMDGRRLAEDAERLRTKSNGEHCSLNPVVTIAVNGREVAVCHRHKEAKGIVREVVV